MRSVWLHMAATAAPAALVAGCGCGDDGGAAEPDAAAPDMGVASEVALTSGDCTLTVGTGPVTLSLARGGDVLTEGGDDAIRIAQVALNEGVYADPEAPPDSAEWRDLGEALRVEGGEILMSSGWTVVVEAAAGGIFRVRLSPPEAATDPVDLIRVSLSATETERFFGFGELWDRVSTRGQVRAMQFRVDGALESGLNELHAPVPLAISPRGWALLVTSLRPGAFDVMASAKDRIAATFAAPRLELALLCDADPVAILEKHASLTSLPAVPPYWAFGPLQWRNEVAGAGMVLQDAADIRANDVPTTTIWIDNPWQTAYNSFTFADNFPDPAGMVAALNDLGFQVMVWSTPYLSDENGADYDEAQKAGYFVKLGDADYPPITGFGNAVDFTNPDAVAFWQDMIRRVADIGIVGFKLDYGEDFVADLIGRVPDWHVASGAEPTELWKIYVRVFHQTYLDAVPGAFLLTRSGALGEQDVNTAIWPCDIDSDFSFGGGGEIGGLPTAVAAGLSLSASGFPFYGSDIGGFRGGDDPPDIDGRPAKEVLIRWAEYAALGTIMQLGGGGESHNPWDFSVYDQETLDIYRAFARLHTDLFPYLYTLARRASETGRPVTVPLGLAFGADEETWGEDWEYMLGDSLLVAPMIGAGTSREVYLPEGRWTHWFTRDAHDGPERFEEDVPLDEIPLYVRDGAVLPMLATPVDTLAPDDDPAVDSYEEHLDELAVVAFPGAEPTSFTVFDGTVIDADGSDGAVVTITAGSQFSRFVWRVRSAQNPDEVLFDGMAYDGWTWQDGFVVTGFLPAGTVEIP